MLTLAKTARPDVYQVLDAPEDMPIELIASAVERYIEREWPCPMLMHGATRYSVCVGCGRKVARNVYVRIALS
jgi:hypothetical protein